MKDALKFVLKLGFVPDGWLTHLAGFTGIVVGVVCLIGVDLSQYHLVCPADPWLLITGGGAAIGIKRFLERKANGTTVVNNVK